MNEIFTYLDSEFSDKNNLFLQTIQTKKYQLGYLINF